MTKASTKDDFLVDLMSGTYGFPHPANMFGWLGDNVNPAWYMTEFQGAPVYYRNGNPLSGLMGAFTGKPATGGGSGTPKPSEPWQRQNPTNVTDLLRQLSANAGEIGMPGGYVGGVQIPAYRTDGPQLPAINNPDMRTYGRTPGYGEATFYRQSMQGGMAPIAAMSPLGVPEDWKPNTAPAPTTPAPTAPKPTTPTAPKPTAPKPTAPTNAAPPWMPKPGGAAKTPEQQLLEYLNAIGNR